MQRLLRALDILRDVVVFHRADNDEIDFTIALRLSSSKRASP